MELQILMRRWLAWLSPARLAVAFGLRAASRRWPARLGMVGYVFLLVPLALAACNNSTPAPPVDSALNQLHWCDKPTTLFQDASQSPPTAISDWKTVKGELSFTIYLPATLPNGTCLVDGHAIVHDKVLGSSFSIAYQLPGGTPLALSETLVSGSGTPDLQCQADSSSKNTLLCLGTKGQTSVVVDSKQSQKDLETFFTNLKPDVDWLPAK